MSADELRALSSETLIMVDPKHTAGGKLVGVTLTCASGRGSPSPPPQTGAGSVNCTY